MTIRIWQHPAHPNLVRGYFESGQLFIEGRSIAEVVAWIVANRPGWKVVR